MTYSRILSGSSRRVVLVDPWVVTRPVLGSQLNTQTQPKVADITAQHDSIGEEKREKNRTQEQGG